jgi:hypothetical protein
LCDLEQEAINTSLLHGEVGSGGGADFEVRRRFAIANPISQRLELGNSALKDFVADEVLVVALATVVQ